MNNAIIPLVEHQIEDVRLENGCRIIKITVPSMPVGVSTLWVDAGSRVDPPEKLGLSHFVEHLLFMRTQERGRIEQQIFLEERGIYTNACTSRDCVDYFFTHLPEFSQTVVDSMVDGLLKPIFLKEDVDREREVIASEIREGDESPTNLLYKEAAYAFWGREKLGAPIAGLVETVAKISESDCNEFVRDYYRGKNLTFVFINNALSMKELSEKILAVGSLKDLPAPVKFSGKLNEHSVFVPFEMKTVEMLLKFKTDGFPGNAKERALQQLVGTYFCGGFLGRFNQRLRFIDPVTYWVSQSRVYIKDGGYISFYLSTLPEKVNKVIGVIKEEIDAVKNGDLTDDKLAVFKPTIKMGVACDSANLDEIYDWYGYWPMLSGEIMTYQDYLEAIDEVSATDVIEYVRKYFIEENQVLAHIGKEKVVW